MTTHLDNQPTRKHPPAFSIRVKSEGEYETYSIVYDAIDTVIAAMPYFIPTSVAKPATQEFLDALNVYYAKGGYFPNH